MTNTEPNSYSTEYAIMVEGNVIECAFASKDDAREYARYWATLDDQPVKIQIVHRRVIRQPWALTTP